jgi:cytidylate kinase
MSEHSIAQLAERRMRQWVIGLELEERHRHQEAAESLPELVHPYLTISRDAGAGASELAQQVGQLLGWQVLDRELLDYMAKQYQVPKAMVSWVDETTSSWLVDTFGKWLDRRLVTVSEYLMHLGQIVLLAAQSQSTIFVGRGAQFFLPRDAGLVIRLVAPLEQQLNRVMQREGMDKTQARRYLEQTDRTRRAFIRENFHCDVTDPNLYDLVLNLEYLSLEEASELIVSQCERRFGVKRHVGPS